jgi:serine/threonine-protein kinase
MRNQGPRLESADADRRIDVEDTNLAASGIERIADGAAGSGRAKRTILPQVVLRGANLELEHTPADRFEVVSPLGEGALGEVVLARDNDVGRLIAVKSLKAERHDAATLARFVEEVRIVGQLEHPGIPPLHDVGVDDRGRYYFVMKYVEGETLDAIIEKLRAGDPAYHARFTFEYRALVFRDVLRAVEYAHSRGIIHRDIKPANIMVGPRGEALVADWGLARKIRDANGPDEPPSEMLRQQLETIELKASAAPAGGAGVASRLLATEQDSIVGTPAFMSPEQARGRNDEVDERSDVYSLAATFYRFLSLEPYLPLKRTAAEMLRAVALEEPIEPGHLPLTGVQPIVPRELSVFVMRGLAKNPDLRYQSVRDMLDELQRCFEGQICVVCPPTFVKRVGSVIRHGIDARTRSAMGFTLAGVFGGAALALYGLLQVIRQRDLVAAAVVALVVGAAVASTFITPARSIRRVRRENERRLASSSKVIGSR